MKDTIFDLFGWVCTGTAISINSMNWIYGISINQLLTIVVSLLSIVFLVMKMYDQYLVTKERKDAKKEKT